MAVMSTNNGIQPYPKLSGARGRTKVTLSSQEGNSMKCTTCGMPEKDNPAHADDYSGAGKHGFKGAAKSLLMDDSPVFFGGELKSLGNGRLGGWAIVFSDDASPDLTNDYFDKETDFFFEGEQKAIRPVLYDHGLDATLKSRKLGRGTLEIKDAGVWFETQLDIADAYDKKYLPFIETMAKSGRLGISTGSAPHLIQREAVGKAMHMKAWPIVEISLTPKPIEPRTKKAMALKSWAETDKEDPLEELKAQIDDVDLEDEDTPHEFEASDDDAEVCEGCGDTFDEGNHASKKALEFLKGGPGSGPRPGHGRRGYVAPAGRYREADELGSPSGDADHAPLSDPEMVFEKTGGHIDKGVWKPGRGKGDARGKSGSRLREAFKQNQKSVKSLFEEKLAQRTQSVYELDRARDEVFRDIIAAGQTSGVTGVYVDKRQKVTECVTEYAARLIVLVLEQMQKFEDGEYDNSMSSPVGGQTQFYLRSLDEHLLQSIKSFLSIKSDSGVRLPLDEHSSLVVSALDEFAETTKSLLEGVESWGGRLEQKIQFRANDNSKSGRTISAATLSKLTEARQKLAEALATSSELDGHLGGLIELATPQKAVDLTGVFTLMLAEHDMEMAGVPLTH